MAEGQKPYRLYRGGRKKGKVPLGQAKRPTTQPTNAKGAPRRRRRWALWAILSVISVLALAVASSSRWVRAHRPLIFMSAVAVAVDYVGAIGS